MEKIEHWKPKGNGPWIVLRLEPSKSNEDTELRLAEIVFRPVNGGEILPSRISPELWKRYNGYRAITIFLLLAATKRTTSIDPADEVSIITTPLRPSWPNTFCELLQKKKFENSCWLQKCFGVSRSQKSHPGSSNVEAVENGLAQMARSSGRTGKKIKSKSEVERVLCNPEASRIELFLKTSCLNPKNITIIKGVYADAKDEGITSPKDLLKLAQAIESADSVWWKTLAKAPALNSGNKGTQKDQAKQNNLTVPTPPTPLASHSGFKSLAETLTPLPVESISSHITAALLPERGSAAVEISMGEILSPECINLIAEKIVSGTINEFCDFYYQNYDSPPNIKKCVARVIAANKDLRSKLANKVANASFRDMLSWFQSFSLFCDRQIVLDVEHAFMASATEPSFKDKFTIYSVDHLNTLIDHFAKYGCASVCHFFGELCSDMIGNPFKRKKLSL